MCIRDSAYFVSKEPANDDDAQTYYASIKRIKSKLPTEINGNKNIDAIFAAIADKAFPQSHSNYQSGIHAFLKTPVFNANGVDYKALDTEPTITQKYGNVQGVKIYPTFSSRGYLVMAISLTSYDSGKKREKIYYVNYNRRGQSVLSFNSIFASNSEDALLTLVNNKIESLADDEGMPLHKATRLSANVYARKRGIFFVYQAGEIADAVSYTHLANSYEGLLEVCRKLHLPEADNQEVYRRMVFNILSNNTDDHIKNFSFVMNERGEWRISPAYDLTYVVDAGGYLPDIDHCMYIRAKLRDITLDDALQFAKDNGIRRPNAIIQAVARSCLLYTSHFVTPTCLAHAAV